LLGLILVNFGPLKIFPKTKPPISLKTEIKITNQKNKKLLFFKRNAEIIDKIKNDMPNKKEILLTLKLRHSNIDKYKIIIKKRENKNVPLIIKKIDKPDKKTDVIVLFNNSLFILYHQIFLQFYYKI